jgi:hypothetical protein
MIYAQLYRTGRNRLLHTAGPNQSGQCCKDSGVRISTPRFVLPLTRTVWEQSELAPRYRLSTRAPGVPGGSQAWFPCLGSAPSGAAGTIAPGQLDPAFPSSMVLFDDMLEELTGAPLTAAGPLSFRLHLLQSRRVSPMLVDMDHAPGGRDWGNGELGARSLGPRLDRVGLSGANQASARSSRSLATSTGLFPSAG